MFRLWARKRDSFGIAPRRIENLEGRYMLSAAAPTVTGVYAGSTEWSSAFYDHLNPGANSDLGFQIPGGSLQTKSLPWANIDRISIRFSEDVNVKVGDLSISGANTTSLPFEHFFYDAFAHVATWTLAQPLAKNSYELDLNGNGLHAITDLDGNFLDGEWVNNADTFPSGNGVPGGDFAFAFRVMPGDVNGSAAVDNADVSAVSARVGSGIGSANYDKFADVDGSGTVTADDSQDVQAQVGSTYPAQAPIGRTNDAPSTSGGMVFGVTNSSDVSVPLREHFQDVETPDSQLVFTIIASNNSHLLDVASINPNTGQLTLSAAAGASGRATLTVQATDAAGLTTTARFVIDVNYENQPPVFEEFNVQMADYTTETFELCGYVSYDDGPVEGLIVHFAGAYTGRASVRADGTFLFAIILPQEQWGEIMAIVEDPQGAVSELLIRSAGV